MSSQMLYDQCYKAFRVEEHEWNQGMIYISVNSTIQRLNELVYPQDLWEYNQNNGTNLSTWPPNIVRPLIPVPWRLENKHFSCVPSAKPVTASKKVQYDATCVAELSIEPLGNRMGTGADTNADIDTASKSSQAYALRKAANQFGVGMYLLRNPKEEDALIQLLKRHTDTHYDDGDAMKQAVIMLMDIRKIEVSAANIVSTFGVTQADLKSDGEIWRKILKQENRI